jgi:hypothetical protein
MSEESSLLLRADQGNDTKNEKDRYYSIDPRHQHKQICILYSSIPVAAATIWSWWWYNIPLISSSNHHIVSCHHTNKTSRSSFYKWNCHLKLKPTAAVAVLYAKDGFVWSTTYNLQWHDGDVPFIGIIVIKYWCIAIGA